MNQLSKTTTLLGLAIACLTGCQSADKAPCTATPITQTAPPPEQAALRAFIEAGRIRATADGRGFYYTIQNPGKGAKPTVCSEVTVNYKGQLTDGTPFDSGNDVQFGLQQLVVGWQAGIPLIAPGGSITLYLPPSLAYGEQAQSGIPANSILVFQIDLLKAE